MNQINETEGAEPAFVELLGQKHAVTLPDFATRGELNAAYYEVAPKKAGLVLYRVLAAHLGLCTRIGRKAGADYDECNCNVLTYGGKVLSYLMQQGVSHQAIIDSSRDLVTLIRANLFPRQSEVDVAMGESVGGGAS